MRRHIRYPLLALVTLSISAMAAAQQPASETGTELPGEKSAAPPYGLLIMLAQAEKALR